MAKVSTVACVLLGLYLVASVHILRVVDASTADALVFEDGFFEMFGATCLLLGAIFAFVALVRLRRLARPGRFKQLAYLGIALFLFLAAGEELSWGQRLLGFDTPSAVSARDSQEETNLHNIGGNANGQNLSEVVYKAFWFSFGVLIPVAALLPRLGTHIRRFLPVVPIWLAILFVGQQALWTPVRAEWRADPGAWSATYRAPIGESKFRVETLAEADERNVTGPAGLAEIIESNLQLMLGIGALCLLAQTGRRSDPGRQAQATAGNEEDATEDTTVTVPHAHALA